VVDPRRRRTAAPEGAQVGEDLRDADGGQPQLEAARSAQRIGEDAEAEAVVRDGAGSGDLARTAVEDLAAGELAAARSAVRADLLRAAAQVRHLDVRDPPPQRVRGERLADHRAE